jgi:hypothetical protein
VPAAGPAAAAAPSSQSESRRRSHCRRPGIMIQVENQKLPCRPEQRSRRAKDTANRRDQVSRGTGGVPQEGRTPASKERAAALRVTGRLINLDRRSAANGHGSSSAAGRLRLARGLPSQRPFNSPLPGRPVERHGTVTNRPAGRDQQASLTETGGGGKLRLGDGAASGPPRQATAIVTAPRDAAWHGRRRAARRSCRY